MLNLIVATDKNGMIAKDGKIPWYCREDLKHFKSITDGSKLIMGRKTFESLPKILSNRDHFVITKQKKTNFNNVYFFNDYLEAYWSAYKFTLLEGNKNIFIIGGSQIYKIAMESSFCPERIYLSIIEEEVEPNETSLYFEMNSEKYYLFSEEKKEGFILQEWHKRSKE